MLTKHFTLLELTDLALRVPEIGAVNFNILHTVLTSLIVELELGNLRPQCYVQDEALAQAAITKARMERPDRQRRPTRAFDRQHMKDRLKVLKPPEEKEEDPVPEVVRDILEQIAPAEDPGKTASISSYRDEEDTEKEKTKEVTISNETMEDQSNRGIDKNMSKESDVSGEINESVDSGKSREVTEENKSMEKISIKERGKDVSDPDEEDKIKAEKETEEEIEEETQEEKYEVVDSKESRELQKEIKSGEDIGKDEILSDGLEPGLEDQERGMDGGEKGIDKIESMEAMIKSKDKLAGSGKSQEKLDSKSEEKTFKETTGKGESDNYEPEKTTDENRGEAYKSKSEESVARIVARMLDQLPDSSIDQKAMKAVKSQEEISQEERITDKAKSDVKEQKDILKEIKKDIDEETESVKEIVDSRKSRKKEKSIKSKEDPSGIIEKVESDAEESEDEQEIPFDEMTVGELQETAKELLEHSADIFAEKAAAVTDALKILEDEELLDSEPARVMEEVWRATNINRRMEAAEAGLRELSAILDAMLDKVQDMEEQNEEMMRKTKAMLEEIGKFVDRMNILEENSRTHSLRIDDSNEQRESEVKRLEEIIKELMSHQEDTNSALENLHSSHDDLAENVAYKEDLNEAKTEVYDVMESKLKELRKLLREVEDTLVKKDDYAELVTRVEELEESKVSRDELGRLLEPGFIESFLEEMSNLRSELEELKIRVDELEKALGALTTRIDEEIVKTMETNFADINSRLEAIDAQLLRLDPDEINDSFVNLEEQADMIIKELEDLKNTSEQFQREAKIFFNKIDNVNDLLKRLEQTKADKTKMYELLEQKADIDLLMNKLDRGEFVSVVGEMKEDLERLTITVKINEEEMGHNFLQVRQELALKMYTEDFITATQPIRNRIKALMYELERVKEISLTHLFPDAPGITKCISCKRGAHMAGPKYLGDANIDLLQEISPGSRIKITTSKSVKFQSGAGPDSTETRLPPIDLDSVPIPPLDKPREKDLLRLPVLFAEARPNIGLAHEMRRSAIDKKLAAYFATRPVRPCEGEYTRTLPQQRGVKFTSVMMPQQENREEVLLPGIDKGIYRGMLYDDQEVDSEDADGYQEESEIKDDQSIEEKKSVISSLKEPRTKKGFIKPVIRSRRRKLTSRDCVTPTVVSLHVDGEPVQKTEPLRKSRQNLSLPSNYL